MGFRDRDEPVLIALALILVGLAVTPYVRIVAHLEARGVPLPFWKHVLLVVMAGVVAVVSLTVLMMLIGSLYYALVWIVSRFRKR